MNIELIKKHQQICSLECQGCAMLVQHLHMLKERTDDNKVEVKQLCDRCFKQYNLEVLRQTMIKLYHH